MLELETLKIKNIDLNAAVEKVVARQLTFHSDRIETLEAIVTDKTYQLNENLRNLG